MSNKEKMGDVVYTPKWVARDMVTHFAPTGTILEPCKGGGAFMDVLPPDTDWCEIALGKDFFAYTKHVDWVVSNPPYSLTRKWFRHSYKIADNLLYLVPLRNIFSGYGFVREIYDFGGIVEIRMYGTGSSIGFPMGNAVGAFHIQKGYAGSSLWSFAAKETVLRPVTHYNRQTAVSAVGGTTNNPNTPNIQTLLAELLTGPQVVR